ncbi:MAG: hypothetical protein ABI780_13510 [Ardenticatenales bacterium]
MTDPHFTLRAPVARRVPLVLASIAAIGGAALVSLATFGNTEGRAQAQVDPLASLTWQPLPGDAPLGGHAAILAADSMTLIGGERADFQPPDSVRALRLDGAQPTWANRAETGDRPQSALIGRGLLSARTVRISADDAAETQSLTLCHCLAGTTYAARWPAGDGGVGWRKVAGAQPLPYGSGLLAFDAARHRVIAAGGEFEGAGDVVTATWALDVGHVETAEWRALPSLPFQLMFQAADRDPRSGDLVAFGGQGPDAVPTAKLWRADLAAVDNADAWTDATALAGDGPLARSGATLTFLGNSGVAVLIGGYAPGQGELADIWALDYTDPAAPSWRALTPAGAAPSPRSGHSAVWDGARRRVIVYGGLRLQGDGVAYLSDAIALALEPGAEPTTAVPTATTSTATTAVPTAVPTESTPSSGGRIFLPNALKSADARNGL